MDYKELVKQYRSKLIMESILKSIILGTILGFALCFITVFAMYSLNFDGIWFGLGAFVIGTGLSIWGLYSTIFKPTDVKIASRIDAIGLDERVITMMGQTNNDSYMAKIQRENTKEVMKDITPKQVKFNVFKLPIVALVSLGTVTTTYLFAQRPVSAATNEVERIEIDDYLGVEKQKYQIIDFEDIEVYPANSMTREQYKNLKFSQDSDYLRFEFKNNVHQFYSFVEVGRTRVTCTVDNGVFTTFIVDIVIEDVIETPKDDVEKTPTEILDELKTVVENSNVPANVKDTLNGMIDDLMTQLPNMTLPEQYAAVDELVDLITELLKEEFNLEMPDAGDGDFEQSEYGELAQQLQAAAKAAAEEEVQGDEKNDEGQEFVEDILKNLDSDVLGEKVKDGQTDVSEMIEDLIKSIYEIINDPETSPEDREMYENYLDALR